MKLNTLLSITLFFFVTTFYSQSKVDRIIAEDGYHYITTTIDYPIAGTYLFKEIGEPIVQLNPNGTGVFQVHDLSKIEMIWGIECDRNGDPLFKDGFDSASYSLWYKNNKEVNLETGENNSWVLVHFSIHRNKNKMYIMGERVKDYKDSIN